MEIKVQGLMWCLKYSKCSEMFVFIILIFIMITITVLNHQLIEILKA